MILNEAGALYPEGITSGDRLQAKIDGKIKNGVVYRVIREINKDYNKDYDVPNLGIVDYDDTEEDEEIIIKIDVEFEDGTRKIMNPYEVAFYG